MTYSHRSGPFIRSGPLVVWPPSVLWHELAAILGFASSLCLQRLAVCSLRPPLRNVATVLPCFISEFYIWHPRDIPWLWETGSSIGKLIPAVCCVNRWWSQVSQGTKCVVRRFSFSVRCGVGPVTFLFKTLKAFGIPVSREKCRLLCATPI